MKAITNIKQPWIGKPLTDIVFILLPPFVCLAIIAIFPGLFDDEQGMSTLSWVMLVLLIDVAHVYSTLYRTYFDPASYREQKTLLIAIPFIGFIAGMLLYSYSPMLFWRILAYVAVFHFIRQQYGFVRVYSRQDTIRGWSQRLDTITIYTATLYPILHWHLGGPRNFNWFLDGDFAYFNIPWLLEILTVLYWLIIGTWVVKEIMEAIMHRFINIPRTLVVTGTILSWYFGIVYFNGDLSFTLLNVVSHGIPYMALIWIHGNKKYLAAGKGTRFLKTVFSPAGIVVFLLILFVLAYIEEGAWDLAVWKERASLFGNIGQISFSKTALSVIVPLLALPQVTHYILDGFIWKVRNGEFKALDQQ